MRNYAKLQLPIVRDCRCCGVSCAQEISQCGERSICEAFVCILQESHCIACIVNAVQGGGGGGGGGDRYFCNSRACIVGLSFGKWLCQNNVWC